MGLAGREPGAALPVRAGARQLSAHLVAALAADPVDAIVAVSPKLRRHRSLIAPHRAAPVRDAVAPRVRLFHGGPARRWCHFGGHCCSSRAVRAGLHRPRYCADLRKRHGRSAALPVGAGPQRRFWPGWWPSVLTMTPRRALAFPDIRGGHPLLQPPAPLRALPFAGEPARRLLVTPAGDGCLVGYLTEGSPCA